MFDLPPSPAVPPEQSVEVTIVGRGGAAGIGSGVVHFAVLIIGRRDDGSTLAFAQTEFEENQLYPAIGARCTLHYRSWDHVGFLYGVDFTPGTTWDVIEEFDCDNVSRIPVTSTAP